jgi:hypothetical protein
MTLPISIRKYSMKKLQKRVTIFETTKSSLDQEAAITQINTRRVSKSTIKAVSTQNKK